MTTETFKTLHVFDTKYSADSVEWCPISPYKNFFACGTYQLIEGNSAAVTENAQPVRTGTLTLFKLTEDRLEVEDSMNCPAVLDMKWSLRKVHGSIALAAANAAGEVWLLQLENGRLKFVTKCVLKKDVGDHLILSLDWIKAASPDMICASDSRGNISLIRLGEGSLQVLRTWKAHPLEAWIVSCDSFDVNSIYSGGDEGQLKVWDWRGEDMVKAASVGHEAGVTAVSSSVERENELASGSYEEAVAFWDRRSWKGPTGRIAASGGIWRLKWEPRGGSRYLLSACIYGGFQVYDVSSLSVVAEYKEHESLAYGADWCCSSEDEVKGLLGHEAGSLVATCSFYDHKLCVSLWKENEANSVK